MSSQRHIRDFAASIRQRLLNLARSGGLSYNRLLESYTAERFLYRLSASDEVDRFVLSLLRIICGCFDGRRRFQRRPLALVR